MNAHTQDFSDICDVLQHYFDGLYHGDLTRLAQVFHPQAVYATAVPQEPLILHMEAYFEIVKNRCSPAFKNEARIDEVLSIERVGPVTALAKVRCAIADKRFVDLLSLIRAGGRWQIMAKVFHYELEGGTVA
ncbi:nuclear transport factor 2 family protein [Bordetella trematum]|uniref:nuclear transport factor 2 family protein n=1 Tax=Bordetella trematum TaxID=123899 RepID=UPI003AF39952